MKILIKYVSACIVSVLLFIKGDLSLGGAWMNTIKINPFEAAYNGTKLKDIDKNKTITVKVLPCTRQANDFFKTGLPIHLMDESYTLLQKAIVKNGKVVFDIGDMPSTNTSFIVICPVTGNELKVNHKTSYVDFKVDCDMGMMEKNDVSLTLSLK